MARAGFTIAMAYYMLSAIPKPSTPAPLAIAQPSACFAIVPPHRRYKLFLVGSLSTAQPSACFAIVPPHRPYKLFLLGFETATWHVLARPPSACFAIVPPHRPYKLFLYVLARPSFGKPQHRTTLRLLCHRTSP